MKECIVTLEINIDEFIFAKKLSVTNTRFNAEKFINACMNDLTNG